MKSCLFTSLVLFAMVLPDAIQAQPQRQRGPGGRGGPGDIMSRMPLVIALDSNRDGELSEDELANAAEALKTLDSNGDGKLTSDELRPSFGRGGGGPRGQERGGREQTSAPKVGQVAPDFEITYVQEPDERVKLSDFAGKKPVALIFGSCT